MNLKNQLYSLYAVAIAACLILGFLPLGRWQLFDAGHSSWNLHLLQTALLLAALSLTVYMVIAMRNDNVDSTEKFLFHLVVGLLIVHSSLVMMQFWKMLTHQTPDTWSEQVIFLTAAQSDGLSGLYSMSKLSSPPFTTATYGPVFYSVLKVLFLFLGKSTVVGRYLSVASVLTIAVLLYSIMQSYKKSSWSMIVPLLFLSTFPILAWRGSLAKPEFLAACLSLGGLYVYISRGLIVRKNWLFWSATLCGLALLTKVSAFGGFAAISVHLFMEKRYKECIGFISLVCFLFLGVYAALWRPTEGGIWFMTITANALKFNPYKIVKFGIELYLTSTLVVLSIAASTVLIAMRKRGNAIAMVGSFYFLISLCWFMIAIGRLGSSYNYFIEAAVGGSVVIGILLMEYNSLKELASIRFLLVIIGISMFTHLVPQIGMTTRQYDDGKERTEIVNILSDLKTVSGEYVLSDDYYCMDVIQAGHHPLIIAGLQYTAMSDRGIVSTEPLIEVIRNKKVPYVVLENTLAWHSSLPYGERLWPANVLDYLEQNYTCTTVKKGRFDERYLVICERAR